MASRYSDTNKWNDAWFSQLKPIEKLLWNYICDKCDIAGFIEYLPKNWASDIGIDIETIEISFKGLSRGLVGSKDGFIYYIRNFLKHQNNLPLKNNNNAHLGIIKRFNNYSHYFDIQDINEFIESCRYAVNQPLSSPSAAPSKPPCNGNGISNGISNGKEVFENFEKIEKVSFLKVKEYFIGRDYDSHEDSFKMKYDKKVYDSYCLFIEQFAKFEECVSNHSFIGIKFFAEHIFGKSTDNEISKAITKLCGLPIGRNVPLTARFLDVLENMIKNNSNGTGKNKDGTITIKDHDDLKSHYGKPQSFR